MADVFVERLSVERELVSDDERGQWPFTIPCVAAIARDGLELLRPVTFLVGENGSGKSTLVEAIAEAAGLDARGQAGRVTGNRAARTVVVRTVQPQEGVMSIFGFRKTQMVSAADALPGRDTPVPVPERHAVLGTPLTPPYPEGSEIAEFALGCFWGEERTFWQVPGVITTAVGYEGGFTPNPAYEEVCTGRTGHAETVRVVFNPSQVSYQQLLKVFWESHDPTLGMRQGNDTGSQYRSVIFYQSEAQREAAERSATEYGKKLAEHGYGQITTEIVPAGEFYFAEDYHQQYLYKVPNGYCPDHSTGVSCPVGLLKADD